MTKQRSLWSSAGRAVWLTFGAMAVIAACLIVGITVVESFAHAIGDQRFETETLRWRTDGQLAIHLRSDSGEHARSLEGQSLEPAKTSAEYFNFTNESLWLHRDPIMPTQRVQKADNIDSATTWFFHERDGRGIYVAVDRLTKQTIGYLGPRGFQETLPQVDRQFDLSETHSSGRIGLMRQWSRRLTGLDWTGSDLNLNYTGELLVQNNGRRLYLVDLKQRETHVVHDGEPIAAVALMKTAGMDQPRLALRFADRVDERDTFAPYSIKTVVKLPNSVREWAAFEWIPNTGDKHDRHIYVRTFRGQYEIAWADSDGVVLQEHKVRLRSNRDDVDENGNAVQIPGFVAWMMGSVQCPFFSTTMYGVFTASAVASREFDPETATPALYGASVAEARQQVWATVALPLFTTWLIGGFWSWLGVRRLKMFGMPTHERRFWAVWIGVFGLPGYLALRVHRHWPLLVKCSACLKKAPCNTECCVRCGASGIGILPVSLGQSTCSNNDRLVAYTTKDRQRTSLMIAARCVEQAEHWGFEFAARLGPAAGVGVLVVKELRTVAGVVVLGLAAFVWLVGSKMNLPVLNAFTGHSARVSPFLQNYQLPTYVCMSVLLALALGYWQTISEGSNGAWQFLLHRPVSRRAVVLSKLVIGLLLVLLLSAWPIVVLGWWASKPGSFVAPFEWWMTEPFWRMWWLMPVVYLGAFASGLRPARWTGTRLLPLIAVVGILLLHQQFSVRTWIWQAEAGVVAVVMAAMAIAILTVGQERDYA